MKVPSEIEHRRARVEIIPLLDVLLIVLIFFVYLALTMTSQRTVRVALPSGHGSTARAVITIVITENNEILVDGVSVGPKEAVARVTRHIDTASTQRSEVVLRSDRNSRAGVSIGLLALLQQAGVRNVAVEVDGK